MSFELLLFHALAIAAVVPALAMVFFVRQLVPAVVCLAVTMGSLAGIYALLGAPFAAGVQLFLHTSAIAAVFLLAISRLGLRPGFTTRTLREGAPKLLVAGGSLAIAIVFAIAVFSSAGGVLPASSGAGAPSTPGGGAWRAWALATVLIAVAAGVGARVLVRGEAE